MYIKLHMYICQVMPIIGAHSSSLNNDIWIFFYTERAAAFQEVYPGIGELQGDVPDNSFP